VVTKTKGKPRERFSLDLDEKTRRKFAAAAEKLHLSVAGFLRLAAEEKIRRDGLA
jgi:hypothetical protein